MNAVRWTRTAAVVLAGVVALAPAGGAEPAKKKVGPDPKQWDKLVEQAVTYLPKTQEADGSWSGSQTPGVTGLVVVGLLETGIVGVDDPMIQKALRYIVNLVNPKAGHIAGQDPKVQLQNYVTCVNVLALTT